MDGWLDDARAKLAREVGEDPSAYDLSEAQADELLQLARIAAHDSGERMTAPLLCYLVGLAHGRHGGDLSDLVDATVGTS
jgi:hypothetical protein